MSQELLSLLCEIGAVKFGDFQLKSGKHSPIYFDFRLVVSYPKILQLLAKEMWAVTKTDYSKSQFQHVCGVPYTGLPIATAYSLLSAAPLLLVRKEQKKYGTCKLVEGVYEKDATCLIIEDVVTTGSSILDTIESLKSVGVHVKHAVAILDRGQGAIKNLQDAGIQLTVLFDIRSFVQSAFDCQCISDKQYQITKQYLKNVYFGATDSVPVPLEDPLMTDENTPGGGKPVIPDGCYRSYLDSKRGQIYNLEKSECVFNGKLISIIKQKQSILCLAIDLEKASDILEMADKLGKYICILKTHLDLIDDFSLDFLVKLKQIAEKHNFLLFEDKKFADIGATCRKQLNCKHFSIGKYFDLVTVHVFPGKDIIPALSFDNPNLGIALLAEMSSSGNLFNDETKKAALNIAKTYPKSVSGFICQSRIDLDVDSSFVHYAPGVHFDQYTKSDQLGQNYRTPKVALLAGADILIVGRSITNAADPVATAQQVQEKSYKLLVELGHA